MHRRVNGGSAWAHALKKSLQNEVRKPRSVGRVLPLVFALVDPWWTLRDVVKRAHRARLG
jgi:hypothetical protein